MQFQNGSWNKSIQGIVIYDDVFVANNVCSGLMVDVMYQNLHEFIIGEQGVRLNRQLYDYIEKIEAHNIELQRLSSLIPREARFGLLILMIFVAYKSKKILIIRSWLQREHLVSCPKFC